MCPVANTPNLPPVGGLSGATRQNSPRDIRPGVAKSTIRNSSHNPQFQSTIRTLNPQSAVQQSAIFNPKSTFSRVTKRQPGTLYKSEHITAGGHVSFDLP